MTTVSGIIRDTQKTPLAALTVTLRRLGPVVGFDGGAIGPDTKTFTTDSNGLVTMPDLATGQYEFDLSVPANPQTSQTVLRRTIGVVPTGAGSTLTLEDFLTENIGNITPTQVAQANASAESAALSAAAAGVASGRLEIAALSQLANFVYADPGEGQQLVAAGDVIVNRTTLASYEVLASDAVSDISGYTVKVRVLDPTTFSSFGAQNDGVTNDRFIINETLKNQRRTDDGTIYNVSDFVFFTDPGRHRFGASVPSTAARALIVRTAEPGNTWVSGDFVALNANAAGVLSDTALDRFIYSGIDARAGGAGLRFKPSILGTEFDWAQNGVVALNMIYGGQTTSKVGLSFDGDNRNTVAIGNVISDLPNIDGTFASGGLITVAGTDGDDPLPHKDSYNMMIIANSLSGVEVGAGVHIEDSCPNVTVAFNPIRGVERGLNLVNDYIPSMRNYIGNPISEWTRAAIFSTGTGHSELSNYAFNLVLGDDATNAIDTPSVLIGGVNSKQINYIGNMHRNIPGDAVRISMDGPLVIAYNHFDGVTGDIFEGRTSSSTRSVLIESNNSAKNLTGSFFRKLSSAGFIGDQTIMSDTLDGAVASEQIMIIAQRPGFVTGIARTFASAGGGGTTNGNFAVKVRRAAGTIETILTSGINRTAAKYATFVWGSQSSGILINNFEVGDVVFVDSDGAGDESTLINVQIDFFYYN